MKRIIEILSLIFAVILLFASCAGESGSRKGTVDPVQHIMADEIFAKIPDRYDELIKAFTANQVAPESDFEVYEQNGGITVEKYTGNELIVVIPDTFNGKTVTALSANVFAGNKTVKAVCLPESVENIADGAFSGCESLTTLKFPLICADGKTFASVFGAQDKFADAAMTPKSLETLIFTGNEDKVSEYFFFECCNIKNVILPESVTEICGFSFFGCNKLEYIHFGNGLKSVGQYAFASCTSLDKFIMPERLEYIGLGAFEDCHLIEMTLSVIGDGKDHKWLGYIFGAEEYSWNAGFIPLTLQHITVLNTCKEIPDNSFYDCVSLHHVYIDYAEKIGLRAFYGCYSLESVSIRDCKAIGDEAFYGCSELKEISSEKTQSVGMQAFYSCGKLETVSFPKLETLGNSAFVNCSGLTDVNIGNAAVGKNAFNNSGYTEESK